MKRIRSKLRRSESIAALFFLLPNLLGFLALTAIPVVVSFGLSFFEWRLLDSPTFAGLGNFTRILTDDVFLKSLGNTAYFVFVKVPLSTVLALVVAVFLNRRIAGRNFMRTILFLPVVCSSVAAAMIWLPLLETESGLVNKALELVGMAPVPWISSTAWAMPSVIMVAVWKEIGYFMVIFLAGLQGIPVSYYEAARIDGASAFQEFRHITLPLISPTTFFVVVTSVIGSFQIFDLTSVLTQGGPANATNTVVMYIYQSGFQSFRMGYASSLAYALFAVIFVFTIAQNILSKRWVHQ